MEYFRLKLNFKEKQKIPTMKFRKESINFLIPSFLIISVILHYSNFSLLGN